jgi:hypothetical protein
MNGTMARETSSESISLFACESIENATNVNHALALAMYVLNASTLDANSAPGTQTRPLKLNNKPTGRREKLLSKNTRTWLL